jgi:hypothetical protein
MKKKRILSCLIIGTVVFLSLSAYAAMFELSSYMVARAGKPEQTKALYVNHNPLTDLFGKVKTLLSRHLGKTASWYNSDCRIEIKGLQGKIHPLLTNRAPGTKLCDTASSHHFFFLTLFFFGYTFETYRSF